MLTPGPAVAQATAELEHFKEEGNTMVKIFLVALASALAFTSFGDVICSGSSEPVVIDSRADLEPVIDYVEVDVTWIGGGTNATVVISDNGSEVKRTMGAGTFAYEPADIGRHELTCTTYIDGEVQDEIYTATVYSKWKYEIVGDGAVIAETTQKSGEVVIPEEIDGYPVIGVGSGVFYGCSGLTSIIIHDSVTSIGNNTFGGCNSIVNVRIPQCVCSSNMSTIFPSAYQSITNVIISDGVTSIGDYAFAGCTALTSVTIPERVTYIGEHAFNGCVGLQYGDDGFLIVDGWVLGYDDPTVTSLVIPEGVVGIGGSAFANFWDLEEVTFPDSLQYIGGGAFDTCTGLDGVVIPDGVEIIGSGAFRNCTYLRDLTIGEGVAEIGKEAFAACTQLSTLTIPDGVIEIGDAAFSNSWRMLSVKLPLGLEMVGTNMFAGCTSLSGATVPTHAFTMDRLFGDRYSALSTVTICSGETDVCDSTFQGCTALTSVVMPSSVTNVGASAFANCSGLTGLELSESLETIGQSAFTGCTALKAITLPDSVTAIGEKTFQNCTTLANVTLSRSVGEIPSRAFDGCNSLLSMVVPASVSSLGAYIGNNFSALYFLGNAPAYDANVYASRARSITTYVVQGSRGWDGIPSSRDLPTAWNGYPITFWEPNRFNASFNANGGTFFDGANAYACEQITDTAYALPPYEPTLEGFVFDGWWTDPYEGAEIKATTRVNETRDITFYAHWKGAPSAITVRFNANGGTVVPEEGRYYSTLTYETLPVPTREHYKFAGWWTKATGGSKVVASSRVPTADQELFAHWTPETYVIRYNANGGSGTMQDQYFVYGGTITLRNNGFSRVDKGFAGWAVAADGPVVYANGATLTTFAAIQDGVVDLYAVWRGDSYAVRFDSNGGVGSMDNATLEMEEVRALPPCGFTRDGFDFAGWAVSPDGEVVYLDEAEVSALTDVVNGSVVLYAVWQTYTVDAPVITPSDGAYFVGDSCEVSISCATRDAVIYYSTTGKAPKLTDKNRYAGPFTITGTTKIYAVAVKGDVTAFTIATISKQELTLEYALGVDDKVGVSTSSEYSWVPVADAGAERGYCAVSALPAEDDMNSWIELTVSGAGRLTFKCRTSCEWDYTGECGFDCLMVEVDGVEAEEMRLDGIQNGWTARTIELAGTGEHKVRLIYHKDESDFDGEDCAWLDAVTWTPSGAAAGLSVEVNGAAVEFETAADGKTRTATVAAGTSAVDVMVFVGGVDVTAGFNVSVEGTTATVVLKEPYETARSEIAPYQAWTDNGDGNVTLNVEVVPGLYYAADSAATIEALRRPGAAEPAKAGDAVVAPKQSGSQGFYKVWVSDGPIEAE